MFWPPITIRCIDHRNFGRIALVGTATLTNTYKFIWQSPIEKRKKKKKVDKKKPIEVPSTPTSLTGELQASEVAIELPAVQKSSTIQAPPTESSDYGTLPKASDSQRSVAHVQFAEPVGKGQPHDPEMVKAEDASRRRKRRELINDLDWWSKYYVTKEDFEKVSHKYINY